MDHLFGHYAMGHMMHSGEGGRRKKFGDGGRMHHRSHLVGKSRNRELFEEDEDGFFPLPLKPHRSILSPLPGYSLKNYHDVTLCMQLIDHEEFIREDPIGEALQTRKHVTHFEHKPDYWPRPQLTPQTVNKESRGEVSLSLCYLHASKKLTVVILKAKDLPRKDMTALCDPYVKMCLMFKGNKLDKKKTKVKCQTSTPIYHECFTFYVNPETIRDTQLIVSVHDFDLINNNRDIGHVVLGANGTGSGERHWEDMLVRPGWPVAMWHKLLLNWYTCPQAF